MKPMELLACSARTPVGLTAEAAIAAARAGVSRLQFDASLVDRMGQPIRGARDPQLGAEVRGTERLLALARDPLQQILAANEVLGAPVEILLGVPEERPGFDKTAAKAFVEGIFRAAGLAGTTGKAEIVARGHAAGFLALREAEALIAKGARACIVGGVDSYFEPATLAWLEGGRQLAQEREVGGFFPGEAAAFVLVGPVGSKRALRLAACPRVTGIGIAQEPRRIKTDLDCLGEGLAQAIGGAAKLGGPADEVFCDINGERYRSEEWGFAQLSIHSVFRTAEPYRTYVGAWGDVGAASAVLNCIAAAQAWKRDYAKGSSALIWGSSESGLRGAALLSRD